MTERQMIIIERALELHGMGDELIEAWQALKAAVEIANSIQQPQGEILPCKDTVCRNPHEFAYRGCGFCKYQTSPVR